MPKSMIEKMEEAAGISTPTLKMPYEKGHRGIPGKGGVARPWTGPGPWGERGKAGNPPDKGDGSAREL